MRHLYTKTRFLNILQLVAEQTLNMELRWFRRGKEKRQWKRFMQALAALGVDAEELEIRHAIACAALRVEVCNPEHMRTGGAAELRATESGYTLFLSAALVSPDGQSIRGKEMFAALGLVCAAISDIARARGLARYVLNPGVTAALCGDAPFPEPLDALSRNIAGILPPLGKSGVAA